MEHYLWSDGRNKLIDEIRRFQNGYTLGIGVDFTSPGVTGMLNKQAIYIAPSWGENLDVWDLLDRKLIHRFEHVHSEEITAVAITDDSHFIVSCSLDKSLAVWDFVNKRLFHRYENSHSARIGSVATTSDSKYIISGSHDKTVAIWELKTRRLIHRFEKAHSKPITQVAAASHSMYAVSASEDMSIGVWSLANKALFHRFVDAHNSLILSIAAAPSSDLIVSAAAGRDIKIWDLKQKKLYHRFENAHSDQISSVAVSPDSKYIISGSYDRCMGIWNLEETTPLDKMLYVHAERITSVLISKDSNLIISTFEDKSLAVWSLSQRKLLHRLENPHVHAITVITVTSDSKFIISGSEDRSIAVWNLRTMDLYHRFRVAHDGRITSLIVLPHSHQIVSGSSDAVVAIWDINEKKLIHKVADSQNQTIAAIAASPDSKHLVWAAGSDESVISIWSIEHKKIVQQIKRSQMAGTKCLALNDDFSFIFAGTAAGNIIVWSLIDSEVYYIYQNAHTLPISSIAYARGKNLLVSGSHDQSLAIWHVYQKKLIHRFDYAHSLYVTSIAVSQDSKFIISGSLDKSVGVWDLNTRTLLHKFKNVHTRGVLSVTVTWEGMYILSCSEDKSIAMRNLNSKKFIHRFENAHSNYVTCIAVTNDSRYLISGSWDKSLAIWDLETQKLLCRFEVDGVTSIAVSPDSRYIVSSFFDASIGLWDFFQKRLVHRFENAHTEWINSVDISEDSSFIVSASVDKSIAIWDTHEKELIHRFENAHSSRITCIALSKDSRYIISGSEDKNIAVWDPEAKKLLFRIDNAHFREVTAVAITSNSQFIISGSKDTHIGVWQTVKRKLFHCFNNAHSGNITCLTTTTDSKFVISGSEDRTIGVWDLNEKALLHRYEGVHESSVTSVVVTTDSNSIISASEDRTMAVWSTEMMSSDPMIPNILLYSTLAHLFKPSPSYEEMRSALWILDGCIYFPTAWNLFSFLVFIMHQINPLHLELIQEKRLHITLDHDNRTQLDYLLSYNEGNTIEVQQFRCFFFENFLKLVNHDQIDRHEIILSLSQHLFQIHELASPSGFLNFLTALRVDAKKYLFNAETLLPQGTLRSNRKTVFLPISSFEIDPRVVGGLIDPSSSTPLQYSVIAIPMSYSAASSEALKLIARFTSIQDISFFESLVVRDFIDFYWSSSRIFMWISLLFYLVPLSLATCYACFRSSSSAANYLLIPLAGCNTVLLSIEIIQASTDFRGHVMDPWNWIDVAVVTSQYMFTALYWGDADKNAQTFFISMSLILSYTKMLLLLRVLDSMRYLIRMILEVLRDIGSFIVVMVVYLFAFSMVLYLDRLDSPYEELSNLTLWDSFYEVYDVVYGNWDRNHFQGVAIPFYFLLTMFVPLVLLNLFISIMGDTYERVIDSLPSVDAKERLSMIQEAMAVRVQCVKTMEYLCSTRQNYLKKLKAQALTQASQNCFLLVIKPYAGRAGHGVQNFPLEEPEFNNKRIEYQLAKEEVDNYKREIFQEFTSLYAQVKGKGGAQHGFDLSMLLHNKLLKERQEADTNLNAVKKELLKVNNAVTRLLEEQTLPSLELQPQLSREKSQKLIEGVKGESERELKRIGEEFKKLKARNQKQLYELCQEILEIRDEMMRDMKKILQAAILKRNRRGSRNGSMNSSRLYGQ